MFGRRRLASSVPSYLGSRTVTSGAFFQERPIAVREMVHFRAGQVHRRGFSSAVRDAAWFDALSDEDKFAFCADRTLDDLCAAYEHCMEMGEDDDDDFDVDFADGVLTAQLGGHGTWVINKQTPNAQLWWSSPISGPKRYDLTSSSIDAEMWTNTRDGHDLMQIFQDELKTVFGEEADGIFEKLH